MVRITDIWGKSNISTLLVLPLFDDIAKGLMTKSQPHMFFPFIILAYEYGLERAYIFRKESRDYNKLYLLFNENVLVDLNLVDSEYFSLNERILEYRYLDDVEFIDEKIVYTFNIPGEFHSDIELITKSLYSKVSSNYKSKLRVIHKYIPKWKSELAHYIASKDISWAIVNKGRNLKAEMVDVLETNFSNQQEFYSPFDPEKETLML